MLGALASSGGAHVLGETHGRVLAGMFGQADRRNQRTLEDQSSSDRPVVSEGAVRVLAWPSYVLIAAIVVVVSIAFIVSLFS